MKKQLFKVALLTAGMLPGVAAAQLPGASVAGYMAGGSGLTPFYVLGFELGPWQDYLAREMTPEFLVDSYAEPVRVSWMDYESVLMLPMFTNDRSGANARSHFQFELDWKFSGELGNNTLEQGNGFHGFGLERRLMAPGILHELGESQLLGVSAVFAHQSYGVSALGTKSFNDDLPGFLQTSQYAPYQENGYGTGVRLALRSELSPGMAIDAGFQSRIDMEEFANYRGVYSQPADLDIPARASVGLAFQASNQSWLNFSVERVMYSDVSAFASRTLPDQFLSLLGDSTSPNFSWDDLTVYSVGWSWSNGSDTEWFLDVSSRSQPSPTSRSLSLALDSQLADSAMTLGFSRQLGSASSFNVNAAYAPSEYAFGGNVLGITTSDLDQNFELEASWTWDF